MAALSIQKRKGPSVGLGRRGALDVGPICEAHACTIITHTCVHEDRDGWETRPTWLGLLACLRSPQPRSHRSHLSPHTTHSLVGVMRISRPAAPTITRVSRGQVPRAHAGKAAPQGFHSRFSGTGSTAESATQDDSRTLSALAAAGRPGQGGRRLLQPSSNGGRHEAAPSRGVSRCQH